MRRKRTFNRGIENIIELLDHEIYVIRLNKNIKCSCISEGSGQPDINCVRCLGTGVKIKIRKSMAASQESSVPSVIRETTGFVVSRNYYIKTKDRLNNDDIIVDGSSAWFVFQAPDLASFDGEYVYQKCSTMPKKINGTKFLKNFNTIVGRR